MDQTEVHTFRPRRLATGEPTLVCRTCGEWFDHAQHGDAEEGSEVEQVRTAASVYLAETEGRAVTFREGMARAALVAALDSTIVR